VEVAQKQARGRLTLTAPIEEWVDRALFEQLKLYSITPAVAIEAYQIPDFHGDPADRIIVATARIHRLTIVTSDRLMIDSPHMKTLSTR